jgi:outer membrane receptor protein involved in Fe transport
MTNTIGLQARYDDISNVALYSTQARQIWDTTRQDSVKESSVGLYGQNATQWNRWFRTLLGLRYDHYDFNVDSSIPVNSGKVNADIWSPKASLIFGPWHQTEYFVNAGYGFHSNDARGTTIRVDPKDPTTAVAPVDPLVRTKGAELGVRTEIIPKLQSSLALWILTQDSELLFTGDAGTTEPSRASRRQGIEWINYYRPLPWLFLDAELALTKARFTQADPAGDYIPGAPNAVATLGVTVDNIRNWFGTLQVRYIGERPLIEDNSVRADSSTITNMRVGYAFTPKVRLQLDVFNLFNVAADDIAYYYESFIPGVIPAPQNAVHFHPAEPRQFRLTLVAQF